MTTVLEPALGPAAPERKPWGPAAMRDELYHALVEACYELDLLPPEPDAAVLSLYAIMDDLQAALRRTQALDH